MVSAKVKRQRSETKRRRKEASAALKERTKKRAERIRRTKVHSYATPGAAKVLVGIGHPDAGKVTIIGEGKPSGGYKVVKEKKPEARPKPESESKTAWKQTLRPREAQQIESGELKLPEGSVVAGGKIYTPGAYEKVQRYERQKYEEEFRREFVGRVETRKATKRYAAEKPKEEYVGALRPRSREFHIMATSGVTPMSPEVALFGTSVRLPKGVPIGYDVVSVPKSKTVSATPTWMPKPKRESLLPEIKEGRAKAWTRERAESAVMFWQKKKRASQEQWAPYFEGVEKATTYGGLIKPAEERKWYSPIKVGQEIGTIIGSMPYTLTEYPSDVGTKLYASAWSTPIEPKRVQRAGWETVKESAAIYKKLSTYIMAAGMAYLPARSIYMKQQVKGGFAQKTAIKTLTTPKGRIEGAYFKGEARIYEPNIRNLFKEGKLMKLREFKQYGKTTFTQKTMGKRTLIKGKSKVWEYELVKGKRKGLTIRESDVLGETWQLKHITGKGVPKSYETELNAVTKTTVEPTIMTGKTTATIYSKEMYLKPQAWRSVGVMKGGKTTSLFGGKTFQQEISIPIGEGKGYAWEIPTPYGLAKHYKAGTTGIMGEKTIKSFAGSFRKPAPPPTLKSKPYGFGFYKKRIPQPFDWLKGKEEVSFKVSEPKKTTRQRVVTEMAKPSKITKERPVTSGTYILGEAQMFGRTILRAPKVTNIPYYSHKAKTRTEPTTRTTSILMAEPRLRTKPPVEGRTTKPIITSTPPQIVQPTTKTTPIVKTSIVQAQQPISKIKPIITTKPITTTRPTSHLSIIHKIPPAPEETPPPITGGGFMPPIPFFPRGSGGGKKKDVLFSGKYKPSVEAMFLNIEGAKPSKRQISTGLMLRPILKSRRKK